MNKIKLRLSSWTYRTLNLPSRAILLKSMVQSIPLYLFSVLAAPKWVIKAIKTLQRSFLWGCKSNNNRWALVSWDTLCKKKSEGGLGIRDPSLNNQALSAKIWWNWISKNNTSWSLLWNNKYAPNYLAHLLIRFDEDIPGSHIWKAANSQRAIIQKHNFWEINEGNNALF